MPKVPRKNQENRERLSQRLLKKPPELKGLPNEPRAGNGSGGFYGRTSHSVIIAKTKQSAPELKDKFHQRKEFETPSKTVVKEETKDGSPLVLITNTPRHREFVRSFKVQLILCQDGKPQEPIEVTFYQTKESAVPHKKAHVSKVNLKNVKASLVRPDSIFYKVPETAILPSVLANAKDRKREKGSNIPATVIGNACGKEGPHEHSHPCAHRHGAVKANPVLPGKKNMKGKALRSYVTFPARDVHNTMRLVSAENNKISGYIKIKGKLYYTDEIELHRDKKGPLPLIKEETATWRDEAGNSVKFIYYPENGVRPAAELAKLTEDVLDVAFAAASHDTDPSNPNRRLNFSSRQ